MNIVMSQQPLNIQTARQLISTIQLNQLQVLLQSGMVEFVQINKDQITSPQQLLILFNQFENKLNNINTNHKSIDQEQHKQIIMKICTKLLNDQYLTHYLINNLNSIKQQLTPSSQQQQQQFITNQKVYCQQSYLLTYQTLTKIQSLQPYSVQLINPQNINKFSFPHCQKILTLIEIQLQNHHKTKQYIVKSAYFKLLYIVQNVILPIAFLYGQQNNGDCLIKCVQLIKEVINYSHSITKNNYDNDYKCRQITQQLSQIITTYYLTKCQQHQNLTIQQIISLLTIIQAIHSTLETYHPSLISSKHFIAHINEMLRCSNVQSKTANSIAVNIYGNLLKQKNLYCAQAQIFINLYTTLRCFGAHLVKDIWPLFYDFIQLQGNDLILTKSQLIDIIFFKIEHHQNANVVKHCIQSILQQKRSYILFISTRDAIYNSLMRILNYGMHYLDCLFHMDSKMFVMIGEFFAGFFNNPQICRDQNVEQHMRQFLNAISEKISFDHALVSMLNSFTLIIRKSKSIDQQTLKIIAKMIKKYYIKNPIRKRHQMMKGITYLLKNHLLIAQQTAKHLTTNNNNNYNSLQQTTQNDNNNTLIIVRKPINLQYLVEECLRYFPIQYLTLKYNQQSKKDQIYTIIEENFTNLQFNNTIKIYAQKIIHHIKTLNNQQSFNALLRALESVQLILYLSQQQTTNQSQIRCRFQSLSTQVIQLLTDAFSSIYEKYVIDMGQSMYKTRAQRFHGILIQKQCLQKVFSLQLFTTSTPFSSFQFIEKTLTNISYFVKDSIQQLIPLSKQQLNTCKYLINKSFQMIYSLGQQNKDLQQKLSRVGSQFMQWTTDHLQNVQCQLLILEVFKCRIRGQKVGNVDYIEESVYNVFWAIFYVQYKGKATLKRNEQENNNLQKLSQKILSINPLLNLRLFTLSANILFNDQQQVKKFIPQLLTNIDQIADRYDFQNLDQVFNLIENVFTCEQSLLTDKHSHDQVYNNSEQVYNNIAKIINSVIENMLASLNYGVDTKEVIACINSTLNILFNFAQKYLQFSSQLVKLALRVLSIGEQYWMFERTMSFYTIKRLQKMLQKHKHINYTQLFPLLSQILCIEQYRGYDSAIALQPYLPATQFYTQLKLTLNQDADYEGIACRLALVSFINSLVECSINNRENLHENAEVDRFLLQFFIHLFCQVRRDQGDKMFMTGQHKVKVKHWQCIMAYDIEWLYWVLNKQEHKQQLQIIQNSITSLPNLILSLINMVDLNNNLSEVKYYLELFLMKLLINKHSLHIITPEILNLLSQKLLELISQVNKNVSFIVISGMLVSYLFKTYQIKKDHRLYNKMDKLYNALLTYSCSHIAYFRGLSQYFCLETLFIESPYTRILHQTIGQDPDTIILRDKLNVIMDDYYAEIYNWTVSNNLFKQLPTLNRNIVSDTFYMDRIKKLGQELLRQIKGELGFLPYKDIWIESVKATEENVDNKNKQAEQQNSQQAIFQRKIDPSLDFIYFSKTKLKGFDMKILITGAKAIPIYGHLSRTGQIFGLSELILPYKKIIEVQEFKNVACTAEKWLKISEFSSQREMKNKQKFLLSLQKKLMKIKQEGYIFFLLKKHKNLNNEFLNKQLSAIHQNKKILLILDSEDYLPSSINSSLSGVVCFGNYFSEHVQASIFIWQYFKEIYEQKFRTQQIETF